MRVVVNQVRTIPPGKRLLLDTSIGYLRVVVSAVISPHRKRRYWSINCEGYSKSNRVIHPPNQILSSIGPPLPMRTIFILKMPYG